MGNYIFFLLRFNEEAIGWIKYLVIYEVILIKFFES